MDIGISLDTVKIFTNAGFSVIPVWLKSKRPKIKWSEFQHRQPTDIELQRWFRSPCNGAAVTGYNNLVVIDFDTMQEYLSWHLWCLEQEGFPAYVAATAFRVLTRRGMHIYLRSKNKIGNKHFGSVDIKGWGGLVTLPGSIHPSGYVYRAFSTDLILPIFTELSDILPKEVLDRQVQVDYAAPDYSDVDPLQYIDVPVSHGANLEAIKQVWRLEEFFPEVAKSGDHWAITKCPFHDDQSPSFWIDISRQLCGCFFCNMKPMDVINLFSRLHSCSIQSAIDSMSVRIGTT